MNIKSRKSNPRFTLPTFTVPPLIFRRSTILPTIYRTTHCKKQKWKVLTLKTEEKGNNNKHNAARFQVNTILIDPLNTRALSIGVDRTAKENQV
ncbi:MAG: hypothetical protein AAGM46_28330, partial [Cyanobacteria bacterium J06582_2]